MKTLLIALLIFPAISFAQAEAPADAFKAALKSIKSMTCLESKAEYENSGVPGYSDREINYSLSFEAGTDYENEYYVVFNSASGSSWKAFIAFEDYNGTPMGTLDVKTEGDIKTYTHFFNSYFPSTLTLTTDNDAPIALSYKSSAQGYVIHKLSCKLP